MKKYSSSIPSSSSSLLLLNIDTSYCDDGVATLSQERRFFNIAMSICCWACPLSTILPSWLLWPQFIWLWLSVMYCTMWRRGSNALSSGADYRTTSPQLALQRLLLWWWPLNLPLLILSAGSTVISSLGWLLRESGTVNLRSYAKLCCTDDVYSRWPIANMPACLRCR